MQPDWGTPVSNPAVTWGGGVWDFAVCKSVGCSAVWGSCLPREDVAHDGLCSERRVPVLTECVQGVSPSGTTVLAGL